jgi:hypothetical protein
VANGICFTSKLSVGGPADNLEVKKYHLPHIHLLPPDDGLQIGPKHVQAW